MLLKKKIDLSICDLTKEQIERLSKDKCKYIRIAIVKVHGVKNVTKQTN